MLETISNRFQCESSPVSLDSIYQCLTLSCIWNYISRSERIAFREQDSSKSLGQQEQQQAAWLLFELICTCALKPGTDYAWQNARRWHTPCVASCCWNTGLQSSSRSSSMIYRHPKAKGWGEHVCSTISRCSLNCGVSTRTWNISRDSNQ